MNHTDGQEPGWALFRSPHAGDGPVPLPAGPPWRRFGRGRPARAPYVMRGGDVDIVNTALHLRRPLLVTGYPGTGKSSLAHAIADDLRLGAVLRWPVTSRSTLGEALYRYDAVARLRDAATAGGSPDPLPVQDYVTLGPLGTALASSPGRPRVLLIDELDKGDIDLPNDLLTVFEDGAFEIPELSRPADTGGSTVQVGLSSPVPFRAPGSAQRNVDEQASAPEQADVVAGWVHCEEFPVVVITSNGERDFPAAFLRRCVRLFLDDPDEDHLKAIVAAQFGRELQKTDARTASHIDELIGNFTRAGAQGRLATDQLLNAIHLRLSTQALDDHILAAVLRPLSENDPP